MRRTTIPAIMVAAGVTCLLAARAKTWVLDTLSEIDLALSHIADDRPGDYTAPGEKQPEPCVCGSTEHQANHVALVDCDGQLDNGAFGMMPVKVRLTFDESDPLAVTMQVTVAVVVAGQHLGDDSQSWSFARDLLDTALSTEDRRMVGEGDVTAQYDPDSGNVWIWLTDTANGKHRVIIPGHAAVLFMQASTSLVPLGQETADVDGAIEHLLKDDQ